MARASVTAAPRSSSRHRTDPATTPPPDLPDVGEGLTVQETALRTGLSEHTLRYYERAGLLDPVRRHDSSGHRRYSARDVARIATLACLRATGLPLEQMRRYFELSARGPAAAPELRALLETQREVLRDRMRLMNHHLQYVGRKIEYWQAVEAHDQAAADTIATELTCQVLAANPSAR